MTFIRKSIRQGETWSAEQSFGNKTTMRVVIARRENRHRQDTQTGTEI
jgi:hypothetical protein